VLKATLIAACLVIGAPVWAGDAPASNDSAAKKTETLKAKQRQANCLQTGTRIRLKADQCSAVPGRVYSQDDLQRTGQTDVSQALRRLDPRF
jgi:hypothetical protein